MSQEFTAANRAYFDEIAANYDTKPWQREIAAQITEEIRSKLEFIGVDWLKSSGADERREVRLLDYACGTGMVSRALGPYVTQCIGIDLSTAMVDKYNNLARSSNLPPHTAQAIAGDLLTSNSSSLPSLPQDLTDSSLHNFDIAAVGLGFHHFHDPEAAIARLAETVKPGGVILIIDFVDSGDFSQVKGHRGAHTVKTHGFSEGRMKEIFEANGLVEAGYSVMEKPIELRMSEDKPPMVRKVFLGRARKPL